MGSYSVTASGLTSGNYSITYQAGTLTVNKAMLTVTADNQARIYSYANPSFIAGYTGFQNGETLATSGVTGVPALATPATSTSPVGSYPITTALGSLAAGNYAFAFADGTLTVNKASTTTTVSVSAATPLFGVDGVTLSATVFSSAPTISTGTVTFYDGTTLLGTVSVAGGSASLALGATSLSPGSHTIRAVYSGDGNFLGSDSTAALTVLARVDLSGRVFDDRNNDGLFNGTDAGLAGVSLTLLNASNVAVATATTGGDGKYTFTGTFAAGTYRIVASQPDGFLDGKETAGTLGGTVDNTRDWDAIDGIVLHAGDVGTGYNFAEIRPSRIQSLVWVDENDDGEVNFGEKAIAGVAVTLTGTDDRGHAVSLSLTTDAQGIVEFVNLRPGSYTLVETQPSGYLDGKDTLGTVNGITTGNASMNDQFSGIVLGSPESDAVNYNFGERPLPGSPVQSGQTAGIGFWQNKHGQNLIKSLNGGPTSTQLANWLATTFPNMYGATSGPNNLIGKTNAEVAALFTALFKRTGQTSPGGPPKLDAQVLATALAVYVTNQTLAGTTAVAYGFLVTEYGVGAATYNVGGNGAAFGVASNVSISVLGLLLAVNDRTANGLLYDLDGSGTISDTERTLRTQANDVLAALNELGRI